MSSLFCSERAEQLGCCCGILDRDQFFIIGGGVIEDALTFLEGWWTVGMAVGCVYDGEGEGFGGLV